MLKNMRIKTSLLLLLLLFTFMQFFSNGFELVDLKGNQKNTLLLHNIIKEQDTLHKVVEAVYKVRSVRDNIQQHNATDARQTVNQMQDQMAYARKQFDIFWGIPGLTADDPQIGKVIRTAFEQQMNAEQKSIDTLNQTLSSNSIINAQENANAELLAARKNFDNEVTNY
ncbi:TPA: Tar ligand binding domain-containing protein, partial [Citrobacter braakii]|nr:Tar ligand binding domain-containing protein [Citrobacter braakii]